MAHRKQRPALGLAALIAVGVVFVQALLVPLFAWPAANLAPRDLPVVVAGPAPAAASLADRLAAANPGAFHITTLADEAAADNALRDRDAYAAFVVDPNGITLHTASGASPTVAAILTAAASRLGPVQVKDVVPTDPDDPRGGGFAAGFLPLALTSMLAGIGFALAVRGRAARLAGLVTFGVLAGLAGAAVLQYWLGVLPGTYLANAGVIGLVALAISGAMAGLGAAVGRAGIGLGVLAIFLVGNPLSAVAAAPELLPQPWGEVGQWLPVGAGGTLLRSVAYFDGAGATRPLWILSIWALVGLALALIARATPDRVPADPARDGGRRLGEAAAA